MTVRRATALVSTILLVLLSVAVAEAALLMLLGVFSSILRVQLNFQLGSQLLSDSRLGLYPVMPSITVLQGGVVASALSFLACGIAAAAWRYRRWRPA